MAYHALSSPGKVDPPAQSKPNAEDIIGLNLLEQIREWTPLQSKAAAAIRATEFLLAWSTLDWYCSDWYCLNLPFFEPFFTFFLRN